MPLRSCVCWQTENMDGSHTYARGPLRQRVCLCGCMHACVPRVSSRPTDTHLATVASTKTSAFFSCVLAPAACNAVPGCLTSGAVRHRACRTADCTPISRRSRGARTAGEKAWACDKSSTPNALTRSICRFNSLGFTMSLSLRRSRLESQNPLEGPDSVTDEPED